MFNYAKVDHFLINYLSLLFFVNLLLIPPSMYLYVQYYLGIRKPFLEFRFTIKHYYPAIGLFLINTAAYMTIYSSEKDSLYQELSSEIMTYSNFIALLFIFLLQNVYYIYKAISIFKASKKEGKDIFSYTEGTSFTWIRTFIIGYILFILSSYLYASGIFGVHLRVYTLIILSYNAYILYKGYKNPSFQELVEQSSIEENQNNTGYRNTTNPENNPKIEVSKTEITNELHDEIWTQIQKLMTEEKIYLNKDLTIYNLAKKANTNSKYLRSVINKEFQKNFSSYINTYRVNEAKRLLLDEKIELYNIEYIGELSGFKSKSSFYTVFKQSTGLTPKSFREQNN